MLTLIHSPQTRSSRILWLLEELGTPYEVRQVTIRRRDGSGGADPANPNPAKQVPALVDGETLVAESSAVVLYLTDLHPHSQMGRAIGDPERGAYLTWLAYYAGVVEPAVTARFSGLAGEGSPFAEPFEEMTARIGTTLARQDYLLPRGISAADLLLASATQWAASAMPDLAELRDHMERVLARPAVRRGMAKDGTP